MARDFGESRAIDQDAGRKCQFGIAKELASLAQHLRWRATNDANEFESLESRLIVA